MNNLYFFLFFLIIHSEISAMNEKTETVLVKQSFVKPKSATRIRATTPLKEEIAELLENLLRTSTKTLAEISIVQTKIVDKICELVNVGEASQASEIMTESKVQKLLSEMNAKQLQQYRDALKDAEKVSENILKELNTIKQMCKPCVA